ncbi:MAG: chitobiase/beta-hexosaminidase C-terminal domain-containing protein [Bacteroidaceae bacterium]|nr:chitobiase/beta-hexosaminidase C-terminal domain-containing protein [Bacteroidaceae bacterium]
MKKKDMTYDMNDKIEMKMGFFYFLTEKKYFPNWKKSFSQLRTYFKGTYVLRTLLFLMLMLMGVNVWGQTTPKVPDGVYYIKNNNGNWYLWPSVTVNSTTGNQYLTTSNDVSVNEVDKNGVKYGPFDNTYSHWVVKNIATSEPNTIQLINPKLNKYVVIREKEAYGDRDVWLADIPSNVNFTYLVLYNSSSPYKIAPYPGLNNVNPTSGYSFNSAQGADRAWLTWSNTSNSTIPRPGEDRPGLIQFYSSGTPLWSFHSNLLKAPTINDDNYGMVTITENNGLPAGYNIRYEFGDGTQADPTASSPIIDSGTYAAESSGILKVVVERYGVVLTEVASKAIEPTTLTPPDPIITVTDECTNEITITSEGAAIYYTTDGTEPSKTNGTLYSEPFVQNSSTIIRAVSYYSSNRCENIVSSSFTAKTLSPTIIRNGNEISITGLGNFYYTLDGSSPSTNSTHYTAPFSLTNSSGVITIKVIAKEDGKDESCPSEMSVRFTLNISSVGDLNNMMATDDCKVTASFDASSYTGDISNFSGTFDGGLFTISGLTKPLFNSVNGGTINNVILDNVSISGGTNVGAICNEASGDTRIYNCGVKSGTISGTNAGSIVGRLDGSSRVINCYSFATVSGNTWGAGIVGYNSFSSTRSDLRTMVMNCMFYGEITSGTNISPIYGGSKITNVSNLNGYNYYRFDADYSRNNRITAYNCALAAEEKYLTRFEFFRNILNSNRELAAWYATDDPNKGKGIGNACQMAKWVLDPADKPYPILKVQDYYPSVINYEDAPTLGTISLTINESNTTTGGANKPTGAAINSNYPTTLTVYDKDLAHNHFNYRTVRLPYYNEVGTGNCTKNKVVTGWKITGFSGGTQGHFIKDVLDYSGTTHDEDEYPPYNFADRYCTDKDKYSVSGRIFSQGAYYDVPEGVTGITIEPYWGTAVYLSDPTYDVAYPKGYGNNNASAVFVSNMGDRYVGGNTVSINDDNQVVYTAFSSALGQVSSSGTVYDNAIVLVGNYHHYWGQNSPSSGSKKFTIMSADLNNDCEPDYGFIVQHGTARQNISPIRFDFINSPGLGMIQKVETDNAIPKHGIWCPLGWFEVTNTTLIQFTQFEYDRGSKPAGSPLILLGGIYDQFITARQNVANSTEYIHLGSNIWMKEFCNGLHTAGGNSHTTRHIPISVTGGEFESFYLTGTFQPNVNSVTDHAECYINGGKFGDMAGAGQEQLKGDVTWLIDHADITNFYGGGINGQKPVTGNIYVEINNSQVGLYCGGPKFGNMQSNKKVTTKAKGSTFDNFYGAGYGGTSYFRDMAEDATGGNDWDTWVGHYTRKYATGKGISTEYECEFIPYSGGQSGQPNYVGRFYVLYASLSLAETKNVESTLEDCHITGSFYGGGKLGRVDGDITSTLNNCTVGANVYGAGFSASVEKVNVVPLGTKMKVNPAYNASVGVFTDGIYPDGEEYTWTHAASVSEDSEFDDTNKYIYTTVDLTTLGVVTGDVTLNITGTTTVGKSVYGGGEESNVEGNTQVNISGGTITQNVFGGGQGKADNFTCDKAMVGVVDEGISGTGTENDPYIPLDGGTTVNITNGTVEGDVYGGGEVGRVERNTSVTIGEAGNTTLTPVIKGHVFGAGAGVETHGYSALVRGNATVTIQGQAQVWQNVHGGGEKASVGRYNVRLPGDTQHTEVKVGMPYSLKAGGKCTVNILDAATIGKDDVEESGDIYGAGQGIRPSWNNNSGDENRSKRMVNKTTDHTDSNADSWDYYVDKDGNQDTRYVWEYFDSNDDYLLYVETLARASETDVIIGGKKETTGESAGNITTSSNAPIIKGTVYGGSESGFVYYSTEVNIKKGKIDGDVFGGGKGLASFAEAGRVKRNTNLTISDGEIHGNVYGGGSLGDVGNITKSADYNYTWKKNDGSTANILGNNSITGTNTNTGRCNVIISGGTIGLASTSDPSRHGNVFGAGRGSDKTWWCEKAIVYATNVSITDGTVYGTVYGGGEVGRVEDDAKVVIGTSEETGTGKPNITGSVFGGGAGLATHGYSALVRGNSEVTVQGAAKVGVNVYGGGEIASVGRFKVEGGLPTKPKGGGTCIVTVKDNAVIGTGGVDGTGNVFGSCKGVTPVYVASGDDRSKSMQLEANIPKEIDPETGEVIIDPTTNKPVVKEQGTYWDYYETYPDNYEGPKFVWVYYTTEDEYLAFLPTLGLASNTYVTIGGSTTVNGSVYGGGQRGVTLGGVDVNINGGIVNQEVYGGGALANTNSSHWHNGERTKYVTLTELLNGSPVKGYYTKSGDTYTLITDETPANETATYYAIFKTNVNLTGGTINRNVYGGGLGQLAKDAVGGQAAVTPIEAKVYGDVFVTLNKPTISGQTTTYGDCKVKGNIFGCNNLNGSPQSAVTVHVYKTQGWDGHLGTLSENLDSENNSDHNYHVEAVYGGGNLAAYMPDMKAIADTAQTHVIIDGCGETSIRQVYGGGNAASTPATNVTINGTYEIEEVFGGGNGLDDIIVNGETKPNPGANVGFKDYSEVEDTYDTKEKRQDEGAEGGFVENYVYGSGKASVTIYGGKIHRVFGGSNTKGNVRQTAVTMLQDLEGCDFCVDEAYGGGKSAPMDAEAQLLMACIPGLKAAYGGAQDADIQDNVVLTITNGTFDRVFGGNNVNGKIQGTITVNIEETGCKPLIIGQLYGGGNQAPYTAPSGEHGPTLNVKSFTSIGDIYGGGYGETAVVEGDTYVNINVSEGKYAKDAYTQTTKTITFNEYQRNKDGEGEDSFVHDNDGKRVVEEKSISVILPGHDANKMGAIYNVFGGGNAAKVKGNTHVNIGSQTGDDVVFETPLTKVVQGVESATTSEERTHTVLGADIRGNIYGGGNNAEVTGDTNVQIGKKVETSTTPEADPTPGP